MQKLRPWPANAYEQKWAGVIAGICIAVLISLPLWDALWLEEDKPSHQHGQAALPKQHRAQPHIAKPAAQPTSPHHTAKKPVIKPDHTASKKVAKKLPTSHQSPAYFIQVGAFQDISRAKSLQKRLIKQHWPVILQKKKHLYAVQIGPYRQKEAAIHVKNKLSQQEKINGFLTRHAYP